MDRTDKDKKPALLGREIFLQFDKVVILKKQNRIKDLIEIEKLVYLQNTRHKCAFVYVDKQGASIYSTYWRITMVPIS